MVLCVFVDSDRSTGGRKKKGNKPGSLELFSATEHNDVIWMCGGFVVYFKMRVWNVSHCTSAFLLVNVSVFNEDENVVRELLFYHL